MAEYTIKKATPTDTEQYIVTYLKDIETVDATTVSVVERTENVTEDGLNDKITALDDQITAIGVEKAKVVQMLKEAQALTVAVVK